MNSGTHAPLPHVYIALPWPQRRLAVQVVRFAVSVVACLRGFGAGSACGAGGAFRGFNGGVLAGVWGWLGGGLWCRWCVSDFRWRRACAAGLLGFGDGSAEACGCLLASPFSPCKVHPCVPASLLSGVASPASGRNSPGGAPRPPAPPVRPPRHLTLPRLCPTPPCTDKHAIRGQRRRASCGASAVAGNSGQL